MRTGKILPVALKNLFSKPATVAYPAKQEDSFADLRGLLGYDAEKCIGCLSCKRDCPTGALEIIKIADKQFKAVFHADSCVFCGQCVDSCPREGALWYTNAFELAALTRESMSFDL